MANVRRAQKRQRRIGLGYLRAMLVMPATWLMAASARVASRLVLAMRRAASRMRMRVGRQPMSARNEQGIGQMQPQQGISDDVEGTSVH
jgi:hypothetical protein